MGESRSLRVVARESLDRAAGSAKVGQSIWYSMSSGMTGFRPEPDQSGLTEGALRETNNNFKEERWLTN